MSRRYPHTLVTRNSDGTWTVTTRGRRPITYRDYSQVTAHILAAEADERRRQPCSA